MSLIEKPKADRALIRVFTDEELRLLDSACDRDATGRSLTPDERKALGSRDRAFLWLLLSTGARLSEACGLLLSDIDWDAGMIYVRGKGAKERKIPFGKVARQHLDTYIRYWRGESTDNDEHVFLNAFGAPKRCINLLRVNGIRIGNGVTLEKEGSASYITAILVFRLNYPHF